MSKLTKQQRRNKRKAKKAASSAPIDALALLRKSADALIELDSEQDYDVTPAMELHASIVSTKLYKQFVSLTKLRDKRDIAFGVSLDQNMVQALTHDVGLQMRQLGVTQRERVVSGLLDMVIGTIHAKKQNLVF